MDDLRRRAKELCASSGSLRSMRPLKPVQARATSISAADGAHPVSLPCEGNPASGQRRARLHLLHAPAVRPHLDLVVRQRPMA